MMKEQQYKDYNLNEKIIYAKGWNAAIQAAAKCVNDAESFIGIIKKIKELDKSTQACDD